MAKDLNWLRYRAKDGILKTHFHADGAWGAYLAFVDEALNLSEADEGEYKLLDTFYSDSISKELLQQIFRRASSSSPVRMLIVDPTCPFAEHRAKVIGGTAFQRAHDGLRAIAAALGINKQSDAAPLNAVDPEDSALLALIHEAEKQAYVSLQFYSVMASGPLYFFKNVLLCGRFSAGSSAIWLPWSMVINDPYNENDLYDSLKAEFDYVWNGGYKYPGTWIDSKRKVFLSYSEHDKNLADEIRQRFHEKEVDCFMASRDLLPGVIWTDELRKRLRNSIEFVVLLTPQSASSPWVQAELGAAWALGLNITPAVVQARLTDVPHFVGSHQTIDVSTTEGKEKLVNVIAERIRKRFWAVRRERETIVTEI